MISIRQKQNHLRVIQRFIINMGQLLLWLFITITSHLAYQSLLQCVADYCFQEQLQFDIGYNKYMTQVVPRTDQLHQQMKAKQPQQDHGVKSAEPKKQCKSYLIITAIWLIWILTLGWIIDIFCCLRYGEWTYFICIETCLSGDVKIPQQGEAKNDHQPTNGPQEVAKPPVQKNSLQPKGPLNQKISNKSIFWQVADKSNSKSQQNEIQHPQQHSSFKTPPPAHQNKAIHPPTPITFNNPTPSPNQIQAIHPLPNSNWNKTPLATTQNKPPLSPNHNKVVQPTPPRNQAKPTRPPSSIDQNKVLIQIPEDDNKPKVKVQPSVPLTLRGLRNIGNTCYMNAALQCLQKTTYFTQQLKKQSFQPSQSQQNKKLVELFSQLDSQLTKPLHKDQYLQPYEHFAPSAIKQKVAESNPLFSGNQQCDSIEFISTFLSIVNDELNRRADLPKKFKRVDRKKTEKQIYDMDIENDKQRGQSVIDEVFTGRYRTSYACQEKKCDHFQFIIFQKFNIHYLQIPDTPEPELTDCLRLFQKEDVLQGQNMMNCEKCQKDTVSHKTMKIYSPNQTLIIVLKRFHEGYKYKNKKKVHIPRFLTAKDISAHCQSNKKYQLYAACLHLGSLHSGHYTAVCLDRSNDKWIRYDDNFCSEIGSFEQVNFDNAYGLFYEQCPSESSGQKKDLLSTPK